MKKTQNSILLILFAIISGWCGGCHSDPGDMPDGIQPPIFVSKYDSVELNLNKKSIFIGAQPFKLSGGTPEGGIYSGPGVDNNKFYPERAGAGTHIITYTLNGISANDTIEVRGPKKHDPNCTKCKGTGKIECQKKIPCEICNNKGHIEIGACITCEGDGVEEGLFWDSECIACAGRGIATEPCKKCKATGYVKCPKCRGTGFAKCNGETF